MIAWGEDDITPLTANVNLTDCGGTDRWRSILRREKEVSTATRLARECRRDRAVRRHQLLEFTEPLLAVDIEHHDARARRQRDIGLRPFCPPAPDLFGVVRGCLEPAFYPRMFPGRRRIGRADDGRVARAAAPPSHDRVAGEDSPVHTGVCQSRFELYVHSPTP